MKNVYAIIVCAFLSSLSMPLMAVKKMINLPRTIGVDLGDQQQPTIEWVDLDQEDAVELSTFQELFAAQQINGEPFILARVMTRSEDAYVIHYFTAHSINRVYGAYPFNQEYNVMQGINPINRLPIRAIDYFIISDPNAQAFQYVCSDFEIISGQGQKAALYRDLFSINKITPNYTIPAALRLEPRLAELEGINPQLALNVKVKLMEANYLGIGVAKNYATVHYYALMVENQQINPGAAVLGKQLLSLVYFFGGYGVTKDYTRARDYCMAIKDQQINPKVAVQATMTLSNIYHTGGHGIEKNYATARDYYKRLADQQINPEAAIVAKGKLSDIYTNGGYGVEKDYATARDYAMQVQDQQINPGLAIKAKFKLGDIYYVGGYGVEKNYATARDYFMQIKDQQIDPGAAIQVKAMLSNIYYYGGHGVEKNYARARDYCMQIKDQQIDPGAAMVATFTLGQIYTYGGFGVAQDYAQARTLLTQLANQNDYPALAEQARKALDTLGSLESKRAPEEGELEGHKAKKRKTGKKDDDE